MDFDTFDSEAVEIDGDPSAALADIHTELGGAPVVREEHGKVPGVLSLDVVMPRVRGSVLTQADPETHPSDELQLSFMQAMDLPADLRHDILNAEVVGVEDAADAQCCQGRAPGVVGVVAPRGG